jgi:hypothetical protein
MLPELENKEEKAIGWKIYRLVNPSLVTAKLCQVSPSQPCPLKVLDAKKLRMAQHGCIEVPGRHGTRSMNGSMGSQITE